MSIQTPLYDLQKYSNVYEPSEDTFLLLDALELDIENIVNKNPNFVIEIGSGSGVIITALASNLKNAQCFATDINMEACSATIYTTKLNNTQVELCNMDLLSCFRKNLFDCIVFNPPYVVTDSDEVTGYGIARAWAGGINGRQIINKFLNMLPQMLNYGGICYMLIIKENNPKEIINALQAVNLQGEVLKERKVPGEHLYVLKVCKLTVTK